MKLSQIKTGAVLSYISLFINNLTALFFVPFLLGKLGQAEYGLYVLIGSVVSYIALLDFGFTNALVRQVTKYRTEKTENVKQKQ
ncbi:hypothetical protein ACI2OX_19385 [Bacillus sp. N9]